MSPIDPPRNDTDLLEAGIKNTLSSLLYLYGLPQNTAAAMTRYATDFFIPYLLATNYFSDVEIAKAGSVPPGQNARDYMNLFTFNLDIFNRAVEGSLRAINQYVKLEGDRTVDATVRALFGGKPDEWTALLDRKADLMKLLAHGYPQAVEEIAPEYGFHFERDENPRVAETDRFILYQILPTDGKVAVNPKGKPVFILPPYVLGANILGFLPGDDRSYAHAFANQGIPTYIRILKDIRVETALQTMTGEDDARDTRLFCETIRERHGRPVTLNGYCQGGYSALCNLLSGELDGLVDAFITCVAPMDGTRSRGLSGFLRNLPDRFNHLDYGTKTLPNGNQVADGKLMGWVYKLKSIESESPVATFYRDLMLFARQEGSEFKVGKTAAALNYWLNHERYDLPLAITRMSFASYTEPVADDGTLPVTLFGRKLNIHRIAEKKIPWLICYGEHDDLVEKAVALAPLDYVEAEVSPFPKGHVAIATSWSDPRSACALHTRFGEGKVRGPVRFQLDLDAAKGKSRGGKKSTKAPAKKRAAGKGATPRGKSAKKKI